MGHFLCINGVQHCWVTISGKTESYSCVTCGALKYWSRTLLKWVQPATSGGKKIPGNKVGGEDVPEN